MDKITGEITSSRSLGGVKSLLMIKIFTSLSLMRRQRHILLLS